MAEYEKLPKKVLALIIKQAQKTYGTDTSTYKENIYEYRYQSTMDTIESIVKPFGILDLNWEDYGFFWKLFELNTPLKDDIVVPELKQYRVVVSQYSKEYKTTYYEHIIDSYSKEYAGSQLLRDEDVYVDEGEVVDTDYGDYETLETDIEGVYDIEQNPLVAEPTNESISSELQSLLKKRAAIDSRIKLLTS